MNAFSGDSITLEPKQNGNGGGMGQSDDEEMGTFAYPQANDTTVLPLYPLRSGRLFIAPGFSLYRASENSFLMEFVQSGAFRLRSGNIDEMVGPGECILVDGYQPYSITSEKGCRHNYLYFDGVAARAYYDYVIRQGCTKVSIGDSDEFAREMLFIFRSIKHHRAISEPTLFHHIDTMLSLLAARSSSSAQDGSRRSVIAQTRMYIAEHFSSTITLDQLAEQACLSKYHLARLFKQETGVSPHRYITTVRMDQAKYLLCFTDMTIRQIGEECGFANQSVFSTAFTHEVGCAPSDYRANSNSQR